VDVDDRGSPHSFMVTSASISAPMATSPVRIVTRIRSATLSNSGPPGRKSDRHRNSMKANNATARLNGGAPDNAAAAISRKNAVAVNSSVPRCDASGRK
jgi:hypothetical protein